jgi:hypothetical protein
MSNLSPHEAAAVFSALDPKFRPNPQGRHRGPATYRGGDNPTSLSVDLSNGGRYFDHVAGKGGDVVDFVQAHLGIDFRGACRVISEITGQDLAQPKKPKRRRFAPDTLAKAERFRVGLIWRIERSLKTLKAELLGPRREQAAPAIRSLTDWRREIESWTTYRSAAIMVQLSRRVPKLVNAAIEEAAEAERELAEAIAGVFGEGSAAA